jgi:hypothetical protein
MEASSQRVLVRLLAVVLAMVAALFAVDAAGQLLDEHTVTMEFLLTTIAAFIPAAIAAVLWFVPDLVTEGMLDDEPDTVFTAVKEAAFVRVGCTMVGLFCLVDGVTTFTRWAAVLLDLGGVAGQSAETDLLLKALVPAILGFALIFGRQAISQIYYQQAESGEPKAEQ